MSQRQQQQQQQQALANRRERELARKQRDRDVEQQLLTQLKEALHSMHSSLHTNAKLDDSLNTGGMNGPPLQHLLDVTMAALEECKTRFNELEQEKKRRQEQHIVAVSKAQLHLTAFNQSTTKRAVFGVSDDLPLIDANDAFLSLKEGIIQGVTRADIISGAVSLTLVTLCAADPALYHGFRHILTLAAEKPRNFCHVGYEIQLHPEQLRYYRGLGKWYREHNATPHVFPPIVTNVAQIVRWIGWADEHQQVPQYIHIMVLEPSEVCISNPTILAFLYGSDEEIARLPIRFSEKGGLHVLFPLEQFYTDSYSLNDHRPSRVISSSSTTTSFTTSSSLGGSLRFACGHPASASLLPRSSMTSSSPLDIDCLDGGSGGAHIMEIMDGDVLSPSTDSSTASSASTFTPTEGLLNLA